MTMNLTMRKRKEKKWSNQIFCVLYARMVVYFINLDRKYGLDPDSHRKIFGKNWIGQRESNFSFSCCFYDLCEIFIRVWLIKFFFLFEFFIMQVCDSAWTNILVGVVGIHIKTSKYLVYLFFQRVKNAPRKEIKNSKHPPKSTTIVINSKESRRDKIKKL